ncbi:MAG: hypothetical protein ACRCYY_21230 [Trueperaceae bacterium]
MLGKKDMLGKTRAVKRKTILFYVLLFTFYILLPSCTFLYLPPELPIQPIPETFDISSSSGLTYKNRQLELSVLLRNVPQEGWLAVQWYAPNAKEAASDSVWIEQRDEGLTQNFLLPQRPARGEWRAVVSFGNSLLRQFSYTVE